MKHALPALISVIFGLATFASGWPVSSGRAQDRLPSPLECECVLTHGEYETNANVDNASLCVHQIEGRKCRVTVHCLVTGDGPGCDAKSQTQNIANEAPKATTGNLADIDPADVDPFAAEEVEVLMGILKAHFEFQGDADLSVEEMLETMRKTLETSSGALLACVQQYAGRLKLPELDLTPDHYSAYFKSIEEAQFFCGVDVETRWLQIAIPTGERLFLIQFAPLG